MANYYFSWGEISDASGFHRCGMWVCDTYVGRPTSGLNISDLMIPLDQTILYKASSATTFEPLSRNSQNELITGNWTFQGAGGGAGARFGTALGGDFIEFSDGTRVATFDANPAGLTADRTWTGPDKTGTIALTNELNRAKFDHFAVVSNVGTGEDDLYSDTLIANQLATNGDKIQAYYAGYLIASATATRRLRIYFGGTLIYDSTAITVSSTVDYSLSVNIIRVDGTGVRCSVTLNTSIATAAPYCTVSVLGGMTLSNTQVLKITGEAAGVGAASDQVTVVAGNVMFIPAV